MSQLEECRPAFARAVACFQAGDYYEVHDVLEDPFRLLDGAPRRLTQGILQVAVALYHEEEGRPATAAVMLRRSLRHLDPPPRVPGAPALRGFLEGARRRLAWLEAEGRGEDPGPPPDLPVLPGLA